MDAENSFPQRRQQPKARFIPNPKLKFLPQCRELMRYKQFSIRTEETYIQWIKRFIFFHQKRHPKEMGPAEVRQFLTHLAHREMDVQFWPK